MENTPVPKMLFDRRRQPERRKEHKLVIEDRRAEEWRCAADRAEHRGQPVTALLFRNAAYEVETEQKNTAE